jgi:MarR family transcriptional regulator, lower aerobic nicotinate degradation pathway regulator
MVDERSPEGTTPVTDALVQVSFAVLDLLSRAAADLDLSVTQLRLIGILRDRSPSMAALADFLRLDRSSVSGLIDRAEKRGLVERRPSADDARVTLVDLTTSGRDLGERVAVIVSARMDALIDGVSSAERERLVSLAASILGAQHSL